MTYSNDEDNTRRIKEQVEEYEQYIRTLATNFCASRTVTDHDTVDEYVAVALSELVRAAQDYDPTKGMHFRTFAHQRVIWELLSEYRREAIHASPLVRYDEAEDDDEEVLGVCLPDETQDTDLEYLAALEQVKVFLYRVLDRLDPDERQVIEMIFGLGEYEEWCHNLLIASEATDIPVTTLRRMRDKAMGKLRRFALQEAEEQEGGSAGA